jgi:hypothetical protein
VAAIAAGVFAILDGETRSDGPLGNGTSASGAEPVSNWKRKAREEALS